MKRWLVWLVALLCSLNLWADAPALLLATNYASSIRVQDYLVSEKLDGVRAYWDGERLQFRSGFPIQAPAWFTANFPRRPLDGELWLGRGQFERLSGIVRQSVPDEAAWREVRYALFELPGGEGDFVARLETLDQLVKQLDVPWLTVIPQRRIASHKELNVWLNKVVTEGGEGLMLHRADAPYLTGRQDVLLKLKPFSDAEATVVAHVPGKGRLAGLVGALRVRDDTGREFSVGAGLSDAVRRNPPAVGTLITYRFRALTAQGLPRFPTFLRLREVP